MSGGDQPAPLGGGQDPQTQLMLSAGSPTGFLPPNQLIPLFSQLLLLLTALVII